MTRPGRLAMVSRVHPLGLYLRLTRSCLARRRCYVNAKEGRPSSQDWFTQEFVVVLPAVQALQLQYSSERRLLPR